MALAHTIVFILTGLLGLIVGSFLNVVTMRWSAEDRVTKKKLKEIFLGRSHCLNCGKVLKWYHMIPIASFFFLKRKCAYCKHKLSWQYPIIEFLTAVLFVGVVWKILSLDFFNYYFFTQGITHVWALGFILLWLFFTAVLIVLSVIDLKHFILPDRIMFPAIIIALLADAGMYVLSKISSMGFPTQGITFSGAYADGINLNINLIFSYIVAAIGLSLFLYLIHFFSRGRAMGFGDVKFAILIGLMLGLVQGIMAFFLSFLIGAVVSVIVLIFFKKKLKDPVPFGPFLTLGIFSVIFWGEIILEFYFSLFKG